MLLYILYYIFLPREILRHSFHFLAHKHLIYIYIYQDNMVENEYKTSEKVRAAARERQKKWFEKQKIEGKHKLKYAQVSLRHEERKKTDSDYKQKTNEFLRLYNFNRYHNDPEFKARCLENQKRWRNKKKTE